MSLSKNSLPRHPILEASVDPSEKLKAQCILLNENEGSTSPSYLMKKSEQPYSYHHRNEVPSTTSQQPGQFQQSRNNQRSIRFVPMARCALIPSSQANAKELWYTEEDFERFRKQTKTEAHSILCCPTSTILDYVNEMIPVVDRLAEEIQKYRRRGHKEEPLVARIFQRIDLQNLGFVRWCTVTDHRGLEYFASKQLRGAKFDKRRSMYVVLVKQNVMKRMPGNESRLLSPKRLAQKFQKRSLPSRILARMMGLADEQAALRIYQEDFGMV